MLNSTLEGGLIKMLGLNVLNSLRKQIKFLKYFYNEEHERFYNPDYSSIIENKTAKLLRTCKMFLVTFPIYAEANYSQSKEFYTKRALQRVKGIFCYLIEFHNFTMGALNRYNLDKIWKENKLNFIEDCALYDYSYEVK